MAVRPLASLGPTVSRVPGALALFVLGAILGSVLASGCGTGAVDVDACKKVETARCRQAPACGIPLEPPYTTDDGDVDACIRYYDTACLHGLAVGAPSAAALDACVAAIQADTPAKDNCAVVKNPAADYADCGWLVPNAVPPEAGADGSQDAAGE